MDSEQILFDMYKQQNYDDAQYKMQKMVMLFSAIACVLGTAMMIIFYSGMIGIYIYAGAVICAGVTMLLFRLKAISLNNACFFFVLYVCFILVPLFWHQTSIMGSAPYISIAVIVAILLMFTGKRLKVLFFSYLGLLIGLTVYSAVVEIPVAADLPSLIYTIIAYILTVFLIAIYMLVKYKKFDEMNDKFLRSSFKDELTRLLNRKLLDMIMRYEESLYKIDKSDYILIMFDVDKFKQMNDEHGHVFGDIILRNIAKCIKEKARSTDFVVRYGGDEFLVVQTNSSNDSVRLFIDRIEEAMTSSCYLNIKVSVSYGFAARSECKVPEEVLELADKRLYEKKAALMKKGV